MGLIYYFQTTISTLKELRHDEGWLKQCHDAQGTLCHAHGKGVLGEHGEESGSAQNVDECSADRRSETMCLNCTCEHVAANSVSYIPRESYTMAAVLRAICLRTRQ